ncbi:MAG: hypothetical protein ACYCSO_05185 [Cuniculiplasma sp.]
MTEREIVESNSGMCHLHATHEEVVNYKVKTIKWEVAAAALLLLYIHDSRGYVRRKNGRFLISLNREELKERSERGKRVKKMLL